MNAKLILWSIVVALGGFLFGFDTAVISGAEQSIKTLWQLSDVLHGLAIGVALFGTVLGAVFGGLPATRLGRKKTLIWIGVFYLVSTLGSALAGGVYAFMIYLFIGGLPIGATSVIATIYHSMIGPGKKQLILDDMPKEAGHYLIQDGDKPIQSISYNFSRKESVPEFYTEDDLKKLIDRKGFEQFQVIQSTDLNFSETLQDLNNGKQLWKLFIMLAIFFLFCEMAIIRFWK